MLADFLEITASRAATETTEQNDLDKRLHRTLVGLWFVIAHIVDNHMSYATSLLEFRACFKNVTFLLPEIGFLDAAGLIEGRRTQIRSLEIL